jgi:valine dehydrogenase (NAD+)
LGVFETIGAEGHESVHFGHDAATGLHVIVAIHSTVLGPSLGGTRFYPYPDERAALTDVLRLSKGMTYKAACAGLDLGGGKAVIIGDPAAIGTDDLFLAYG